MTLRDILERAHCCEELMAFADTLGHAPISCDHPKWITCQDPMTCHADGCTDHIAHRAPTFVGLWIAIDRHDWLTWLMRHCPDQFEDSWRDAVSALHAVADFSQDLRAGWVRGSSGEPCPETEARQKEACRLIRDHVRLRTP